MNRRELLSGSLALLGSACAAPFSRLRDDPPSTADHYGRICNAETGAGINNAIVTAGEVVSRTDADGVFPLTGAAASLRIRAPGFLRKEVPLLTNGAAADVRLDPFSAKAAYLSAYGVGDRTIRAGVLDFITRNQLNAIVIDLKDDSGIIPYPTALALAGTTGALRVRTIQNLSVLLATLRQQGLYSIARIAVFKDPVLADAQPQWSVKQPDGETWRDNQGIAWIDPTQPEAWEYSLGVAEEAAAAGFDEIQFDYVRFPDSHGVVFSKPSTEEARVGAITEFLRRARARLAPYNTFLAVDAFGYVCWNRGDTQIGQNLEELAGAADFICPMLYPSSFQFGIPGYPNPVEHPREIIRNSLLEAVARTRSKGAHYRPWLQAFRDYAFGGKAFDADIVAQEVSAAESIPGVDGWMLWNPRNVYPEGQLESVPSTSAS